MGDGAIPLEIGTADYQVEENDTLRSEEYQYPVKLRRLRYIPLLEASTLCWRQ